MEPTNEPATLPVTFAMLFAAIRGEAVLDLSTIPAEKAPLLRRMLIDMKNDATRNINALLNDLDAEFARRIDKAGGDIPTPVGAIEAVPVYTKYAFDIDKLKAAAALLPPKDAAKVISHVPEQIIEAHDVAGNPVSIKTLRDKYTGSEASKLLADGMTRSQVGVEIRWPKLDEDTARNAPDAIAS